jgi:hypothetical protein
MKLRIAIALSTLALAGAAFAQQPAGGGGGGGQNASPAMQEARKAMQEACAADMKSLCDGKEGREAMMCLIRDNRDKASKPCQDAIGKMMAARQGGGGR